MRKIDLKTFKESASWAPLDPPFVNTRSSLSSDDRWFISGTLDGDIAVVNVLDGTESRHHLDMQNVTNLNFSSEGRLFVAASAMGYANVYETATLRKVATLGDFKGPIYGVWLSPDGTRLVISQPIFGKIEIWDVETQRVILKLAVPTTMARVEAIFSQDGDYLNIPIGDSIRYWHAPPWDPILGSQRAQRP
jgi:WD40 repeat protein